MKSSRPHLVALATASMLLAACTAPSAGLPVRGVLHLADHLSEADAASGAPPLDSLQRLTWDLRDGVGDWRTISTDDSPRLAEVALSTTDAGVSLTLTPGKRPMGPLLIAVLAIDLPELKFADWETVLVRARTRDRFAGITVDYNLDAHNDAPDDMIFFFATDDAPPLFNDGSEQVYAIPLRAPADGPLPERLDSLGIFVGAPGVPAAVELQSIQLVARGAGFPDESGVRPVARGGEVRRTLYAHTPATMSWDVSVPQGGRLDFALAALEHAPVSYVVRAGGQVLLEERIDGAADWQQRSVSLTAWAGRDTTITLEATADDAGAVALWGAPVISGDAATGAPNVIFYVIDGGGSDFMSVYEYNRRTTPFLERLAEEGVVFERAYSNATWTQPSTASFMTSLQHSVLGGLRRGMHSTPVPAGATTFAEHMRAGGYMTASFTSNPNAGRIIGLERGIDIMRDVEDGRHSTSSSALHDRLWAMRDQYPGTPYWVHFQTTDVHEPNIPVSPYAGLYVTPEQRAQLHEWDQQLFQAAGADFGTTSIFHFYEIALEKAGIDQRTYFEIRRGLYDETMAYQDHQLSLLVKQLKARGEWENTILVIGADHGHPAGTFARFGRGLFDPQPEPWQGALFDSHATGVPLMVVWPAGIEGGQRISQPVSMIDVLPTVLDLVGLAQPEIVQGQSLAPALHGDREWRARPVILDEFRIDEATGEWIGNLDIVDGRWGASLEIAPVAAGADPDLGRHEVPIGGRWGSLHRYFPEVPRLLLYDVWNDPFALHAVNDEHPQLVAHYRAVLEAQWQAHLALAQSFGSAGEVTMDPAQLQQLRSLGYIR